ncbi:MAG: hypothetical protein ABSB29_09610 [Nitrososphaerales archaeon]
MKASYFSLVAGLLAIASLALPWWVLDVTPSNLYGAGSIRFYAWGPLGSAPAGQHGYAFLTYVSLILILVAASLGFWGVLRSRRGSATPLLYGFASALLSVGIFALAIQLWVNDTFTNVNSIFYSGAYADYGDYHATAYLSYGFYIALAAGILFLIGYLMHRKTGQSEEPRAQA